MRIDAIDAISQLFCNKMIFSFLDVIIMVNYDQIITTFKLQNKSVILTQLKKINRIINGNHIVSLQTKAHINLLIVRKMQSIFP